MKQRCLNPNHESWPNYGGRGVRVCERLRDFPGFLGVLGERPAGKTLDRIDPGGHYSCGDCGECAQSGWPANVKWSTPSEQRENQRRRGAA